MTRDKNINDNNALDETTKIVKYTDILPYFIR
jgi:hypothetical protein